MTLLFLNVCIYNKHSHLLFTKNWTDQRTCGNVHIKSSIELTFKLPWISDERVPLLYFDVDLLINNIHPATLGSFMDDTNHTFVLVGICNNGLFSGNEKEGILILQTDREFKEKYWANQTLIWTITNVNLGRGYLILTFGRPKLIRTWHGKGPFDSG